jgi:hypothetical protein
LKPVITRIGLLVLLALGNAAGLLAQSPEVTEEPLNAPAAIEPTPIVLAPAYVPLNLGQKYIYSINEIFGIAPLLAVAAHAALDQAGVQPAQWGKGGDSLAIRTASRFGDLLLRHSLEFGVRAVDHEDPRYFRSGQHGGWRRAKYAVVHTFVARSDTGGSMPAYSLFVTDYGMPFVVREWSPQRFHALSGLQSGTLSVGIGMGSNLFNEFWPDLKKKLPGVLARGPLGWLLGTQETLSKAVP